MALTRPKIWDIDTNITVFNDPMTVLHQGATSANVDVGFLFNRANGLVSNVALYWNETSQAFVLAYTSSAGTTDTNVAATSYANVTVGNISANSFSWANGTPFASSNYGNLDVASYLPIYNGALGNVTTSNVSVINNTTVSTSTTTGALQVRGGAGIAGNLWATAANIGSSSANYLQLTGNVSGKSPSITAQGVDSSVSLALYSKGISGVVGAYTNDVKQFDVYGPVGSVNWIRASGASSGFSPYFISQGSDTNIDFTVSSKNSGNVYLQGGNIVATTGPVYANAVTINSTLGGYVFNITGAAAPGYSGSQTWKFFTQTNLGGGPGSWIVFPDSTSQYTAYPGTFSSGSTTLLLTTLNAATVGNIGANIVGTGTYLTALNASNLSTGTVPNSQLSGEYSNVTGVGTLATLSVTGNATVGGNLSVGNLNIASGNVTVSNSGSFIGNAVTGYGALYAGIPSGYAVLPSTPFEIATNANTYSQLNMQNINNGSNASSDYVVTAGNGTDSTFYGDFGIASNTYYYPSLGITAVGPNDTYLLGVGYSAFGPYTGNVGNVVISSSNGMIKLATGGANIANVVATVIGTGLAVNTSTISTSTTTGALTVAGGMGIGGNIVSGGSGQFQGLYNENTTSNGVFMGNAGAPGGITPRIGFFNGTSAQNWQIDNYFGTFRWFTPGSTRMQIDTNGNVQMNGLTTISPGSQNTDAALVISGNVSKGGTGYHDFLRVTSTYSGVSNPNKYFRLDSSGTLQIINSSYNNNLFNLTDGGDLTVPGKLVMSTGVFWSNGSAYSSGGGGGSFNGGTITGALTINNSTASTSTSTGALIVTGGGGFGGNLYADQIWAVNNGNGTNFRIGDDTVLGDINSANTARLMGLQNNDRAYIVFGNSDASNYIGRQGTGPITVNGAFSTGGSTTITSSSTSTSTSTGALVVTGGAGFGGNIFAGGNINVNNSGTGAIISPAGSNANITIDPDGTGSTILSSNVYVNYTTVSSSSSTGALIVSGGVGVGGNLYVASNIARNNRTVVTNFTGNTAPTTPLQGDEWFAANTGIMYKYIYDNISNTYNWINLSSSFFNANTGAVANTLALRDSGGNLTATNFLGVASSAKYADLAEIYASDKTYAPATVVVFGGAAEVTTTSKSHDTRVAGVVSTNPAYLMNSEASGVPVAFTGRVPCLVRGPVEKGDVLVTSAHERYAERMDDTLYRPGCILGKSLGQVAENEFATIEVVVGRF